MGRNQPLKVTHSITITPWPESASELYRPSNRHLSAKLVPTFVDRGCHVVSVTDPYGSFLGFLDLRFYFFFQVAPQLYSRSWVDFVRDPLLLRKSGSAGNNYRKKYVMIPSNISISPCPISSLDFRTVKWICILQWIWACGLTFLL
jgi:hypothetical protein